ncbi:putative alpha-farnesene synthase [Rosa chinensis]|uniref:Putative alpha-farnesene synthase n=1 Tax=Rosa chinensis TaxID=74649 RepID=A0A2P6Q9K5_ROSCH|nr:putative alpha-farnesene synthase [Rosa chinensis]
MYPNRIRTYPIRIQIRIRISGRFRAFPTRFVPVSLFDTGYAGIFAFPCILGMDEFLHKNEDLVYNISLILRLLNDLGTSVRRCCFINPMLHERSECFRRIARKHIKCMIDNAWKKINEKCFTQVPDISSFFNITTNIAPVGHSLYQDRDGFGDQEQGTRGKIQTLLVEPLS